MQVHSTNKKSFQLKDNDQLLGELEYENLFYLKATIKLPNGEQYKIEPLGFFGTSIKVIKNETETASLKMNWSGQILISFLYGQEFLFKSKSAFSSKYIIENQLKETVIQYEAKYNWSKFQYTYELSCDNPPQNILLIMLGLYAANYYIATMSGATGSMG